MVASFTVTINSRGIVGNLRYVEGKGVSAGGGTGGNLTTGLRVVQQCLLQQKGTGVGTGPCVVNETLPLVSGDVTIVSDADATVYFMAFGK